MEVSHHKEADERFTWTKTKAMVFVLDDLQPDQKKLKTEGKPKGKINLTNKNFGAHLSIPKVKGTSTLALGWRCRLRGTHHL